MRNKKLIVIFEKGLARGKISADQAEQAHQNLSYESDLAKAAGNADLIIEAVPEIGMRLKSKCLKRLKNMLQHIVILQRIHRR